MKDASTPPALSVIAFCLAVDALTAEVIGGLENEGVHPILLKGPSIANWLYRSGERPYTDVDLLVDADRLEDTRKTLEGLGFRDVTPPAEATVGMGADYATNWARRPGEPLVDLHTYLPGAKASPRDQWKVLDCETESLEVSRSQVRVLTPIARGMHISLHSARHGPRRGRPLQDLEQLLAQQTDLQFWKASRDMAERLDALEAFAAGLQRTEEGIRIANAIGLAEPTEFGVLAHVTLQDPRPALGLEAFAQAPSWREKARILRQKLFPSRRVVEASFPFARKGPVQLVLVYLSRPFVLLSRLVTKGLPQWLRIRRSAKKR